MSFILVAKPADHKLLYQWFTEFHQMGETHKLEIKDYKGRRHPYEWVNDIALNWLKAAGQDGKLKMKHLTRLKIRDIILSTILVMAINTCHIICCFSTSLLF